MAEEKNVNATAEQVEETTTENEIDFAEQNAKLTKQVQELMTQVAKLKSTSDKNASEAADYKKRWRESLSAQEQASQDEADRKAKEEERVKELERKVAINDYAQIFLKQNYSPELAQKAAEAYYDGDSDTYFEVQKAAQDAIIKAKEAEWLKSRPEINAGTGTNTVTKEQFEKMGMVERSELRKKHPEVYERLVGRG